MSIQLKDDSIPELNKTFKVILYDAKFGGKLILFHVPCRGFPEFRARKWSQGTEILKGMAGRIIQEMVH